jgi:hypothetical protein
MMTDMAAKIGDAWTNFMYAAIGLVVFVGLATQTAQICASELGNANSVIAVLAASVLAAGALQLSMVRFLGPSRASRGQLIWTPTGRHRVRQRYQACAAVLLIAGIAVYILVLLSIAAKIESIIVIGLSIAMLAISFCVMLYATLCQRCGFPRRVSRTSMILVVGAMAVLGAAAANVKSSGIVSLVLAGIAGAAGFGYSCWALAQSKRLPKGWRLTPRWELIEADARVDRAKLSVIDLDASHYRELSDASNKAGRRALRLSALPKPMAMYVTVLVRSWRRQWKTIAAVLFLAVVLAQLAAPVVGYAAGLLGSVALAMRVSGTWEEWAHDDAAQRLFAATVPGATFVMLAALLTFPALTAALAALTGPVALTRVSNAFFVGLCAAIVTILGRADAARKRQTEGVLGTSIITPDAGLIPVGAIRTVFAGWLLASFLIVLNISAPAISAWVSTVLVTGFSIKRAQSSAQNSAARVVARFQ